MPHRPAQSPTVLLQVHSVKSAEVQRERPTVARRYATQVAGFQPWQYLLLRLQRPGPIAPELQIGTVGQLQAVSQLHVQCIHAREIGRASCRERVCQYVVVSWVAVELKKKKHT